jgi:SHS2 domain-containing protein
MPSEAAEARARRRWGSFPTTADEGIWARADSVDHLFEALGLGLFALMTDLRKVRPSSERAVRAAGEDTTSLAVSFLSELLLLQQTEGFIARDLTVRTIGRPPTALVASAVGETFDPARHAARKEVKAITLHRARVDLARGSARVIVDI